MPITRVTISPETLEGLGLRNRPFSLGLLLAPVGAAAGTLAYLAVLAWTLHYIGQRLPPGMHGASVWDRVIHLAPLMVIYGMLFGTAFALPVTAVLLPLLHRSRLPHMMLPVGGAAGGAVIGLLVNNWIPGLAGGLVTGLIFMGVTRPRRTTEGKPLPV